MTSSPLIKRTALITSQAALVALAVAACGGNSAGPADDPTASPSASPSAAAATPAALAAVNGCGTRVLGAGYERDPRHSGKLTATTYSASADVQAALEYDQLEHATRQVLLHRTSSHKIDGVIGCVSMQFASAHLANRFLLSYEQLRREAGKLVQSETIAPVSGVTNRVAYLERDQTFRGYHIGSTTVVEAAAQSGPDLFIGSVAGAKPTPSQARTLLVAMAGAA